MRQALLGLCLLLILLTAGGAVRSLSRLVAAQDAVTHTLEVDQALRDLTEQMVNAETGQRGYLLTGRASYLEPYYSALTQIRLSRQRLDGLLTQAELRSRLVPLDQAMQTKLTELEQTVQLRVAGNEQEAMARVMTERGKASMDAFRAEVAQMLLIQDRALALQRGGHGNEVDNTYGAFAVSMLLNLALLLGLVMLMREESARHRKGREDMRQHNLALAEMVERTTARNRRAHALSELGHFLQSSADLDEAIGLLRERLPELVAAEGGALYLMAASRNQLRLACEWGPRQFGALIDPGECWALRRGQAYTQPPQQGAAACGHLHGQVVHAGMRCLPLTAHGELLGLLLLEQAPPAAAADSAELVGGDDENNLTMTLEQVSLSIGNLRLRESLRQQSIRDGLTQLYNRRFLDESLQRELVRAERLVRQDSDMGLTVMMLDVDHFKRFNDQHGHEAGDLVLREVAQVLLRHCRGSDVAARYGGEEFMLLLPEIPPAVALDRAQQLCDDVAGLVLQAGGRDLGRLTVSMGVAHFPQHGATVEALCQAADQALYRAKRLGRNRVEVAGAEAQPGQADRQSAADPAGAG